MAVRDFFLWQVRSFTVRLDLDLVTRLSQQLEDPRRNPEEENGGLLFGSAIKPGLVEVTSFEFLHSEHRRGTLYDLGSRERARVARHIESLNKRSGPKPIGYFRTHLRPGLFLDQDDLALMNEALPGASSVAMVIRPEHPGPSNAGLFFRENGEIDRRQSSFVFPFDEATLRAQGPIDQEMANPQSPPAKGRAFPFGPLMPYARPLAWVGAAALASVVLVMALRPHISAPAADNPLTLRISRAGQALSVDWDPNAPAIRHATDGVLTIDDSGTTQMLNLSHADLERGTVQFWPRSDRVSVRMQVTNQAQISATVTAHAVQANGVGAAAARGSAPEARNDKPSPLESAGTTPPKPAASATSATAEGTGEMAPPAIFPDEEVRSTPPAAARPPAREPAPAVSAAPAPVPPPQAAPEVAARQALRADTPPPVAERPVVAQYGPRVAVDVSMEDKPRSEFRKVFGHVPLLGHFDAHHDRSDYSPAHPDRLPKPKVPDYMAANLSREVPVDIKVSIDSNGRVKDTEVMNGAGTGFGSLAADTAEKISWNPARVGDRRVPSEVILHYRFRPGE